MDISDENGKWLVVPSFSQHAAALSEHKGIALESAVDDN